MPIFFSNTPDAETRILLLDDKSRDAFRSLAAVGHGENSKHVGHRGIGNEMFHTIEDISVAIQHGRCCHGGGVRTSARFCQPKSAQLLTGGQRWKVLFLLRVRACQQDGGRA